MKSIFRIAKRYVFSAAFICIAIMLMNLSVMVLCKMKYDKSMTNLADCPINTISESFKEENGVIVLSEEATSMLEKWYQFGMLLDDDTGTILWSHNLPEKLNKTYSRRNINSMSRWYLEGYPVWTWNCDRGVLVVGGEKDSVWKYQLEYSMPSMNAILSVLPVCNLILLAFLCILFGSRFYSALKPVAQGIEALSSQKRVTIPERGLLADLCEKINRTSQVLVQQKELLDKRDDARTQWIAGVSHDIRTPLSMIMGYADTLEHDGTLTKEQIEKAHIMKQQSIIIKNLIEDLNLTSKLEYQMQPLRMENCRVSGLLRETVADYYNHELEEKYQINLEISSAAEQYQMLADLELMKRAIRNLIGNSIRHNPQGCTIDIEASWDGSSYHIQYRDDGKGIPEKVLSLFQHSDTEQEQKNTPHIMGLFLIEKIICAHSGTFELSNQETHGMRGDIYF